MKVPDPQSKAVINPGGDKTGTARSAFRTCPAVLPALLLITGVAAALIPLEQLLPWYATVPAAIFAGFAACRWLMPGSKPMAWLIPLGFLLGSVHWHRPANTYHKPLHRMPSCADFRGVVAEPSYGGKQISWLRTKRRYVVRVQSIKPLGATHWRQCGGKALLLTDGSQQLTYGSAVTGRVIISQPAGPRFAAGFNYQRYLRAKGILHQFKITEEFQMQTGARGWRRLPALFYWCRDRLVEKLVRNVDDEENARMLAAMVFGFKEALTPPIRNRFLRGGAIHLFAVSGLHVGIAASLVLLGLRWFRAPCRPRFCGLPVLLGVYVFITGGAASAVRAWLMISVWAISKARLRAASPLNAVAVAAIILLLWNPLQLLLPGFQFSFMIVTILLLGWRLSTMTRLAVTEKFHWRPARVNSAGSLQVLHWGSRAVDLSAVVMLAWLGSAGLVAAKNSMLVPAGILSNLLISTLAWVALLLAMLKTWLALLPLAFLDTALGWTLNAVMTAVRTVVTGMQSVAETRAVPHPHFALTTIYYCAILLGLLPVLANRRRTIAWGVAGLCLLAIIVKRPAADSDAWLFTGSGTNRPVIALPGQQDLGPVVLNTGNYYRVRDLKAWLKQYGYDSVRLLVLHDLTWHAASGLESLLAEYPVETLVMHDRGQNRVVKNLSAKAKKHIGRVRYAVEHEEPDGTEFWKVNCANALITHRADARHETTTVELNAPAPHRQLRIRTFDNGKAEVHLASHQEKTARKRIFWTAMPEAVSRL